MSVAEIKEVIYSLNTRSDSGRVVVNPPHKMAEQLEVHTVDQIRLCCNRAFLTFESYVKHKEESACCSPGLILEPIDVNKPDDDDNDFNLVPVIQSVSSVMDGVNEIEIDEQIPSSEDDNESDVSFEVQEFNAAPLISEALQRLSFSPVKKQRNSLQETPSEESNPPSILSQTIHIQKTVADNISYHDSPSDGVLEPELMKNGDNKKEQDDDDDDEVYPAFAVEKQRDTKIFKCNYKNCNFSADSPTIVDNHRKDHVEIPGLFTCNFCTSRFKQERSLKYHIYQKHPQSSTTDEGTVDSVDDRIIKLKINNRTQYKCKDCSHLGTKSIVSIRLHIKNAHHPNGKYQCKFCSCCYTSLSPLVRHIALMHPFKPKDTKQIERRKPQQNQTEGEDLELFRTVIVGGGTRYKCKTCGYSTPKKVTIRDHIERVHSSKEKVSCQFCSFRCPTKIRLMQHLKLHHNVKKESNDEKLKQRVEELTPSMISFILGETRRYRCTGCDFYTNNKEAADRHIKIAHSPDIENISSKNADAKIAVKTFRIKRIQCRQCAYACSSTIAINRHRKAAHGSNGKFSCSWCSCCYERKSKLTQHIRLLHSEIAVEESVNETTVSHESGAKVKRVGPSNPHNCHLCSYSNLRRAYVLLHVKRAHVHGGKFQCPFCSCCYSRNQNYSTHLKSKHPNQILDNVKESDQKTADALESLNSHNVRTYSCDRKACSYTCINQGSIRRHSKKAHDSNGEFFCRFCSCQFLQKISLTRHLIRQHSIQPEKPLNTYSQTVFRKKPSTNIFKGYVKVVEDDVIYFRCSFKRCVFSAKNSTQLKWHIKHSHSLSRTFSCTDCSCRFISQSSLQKHYKLYHRNVLQKSELVSNKKLTESKSLNQHVKVECSVSGCPVRLQYGKKKLHANHLKAAHSPDAPLKCGFCPCRYHYAANMAIHKKKYHNDLKQMSDIDIDSQRKGNPKVQNSRNMTNVQKRLHKCSKCTYAANSLSNLQSHLNKAHVRWGAHKCTDCSCRFATYLGLATHKSKTHVQNKKSVIQPADESVFLKKVPVVVLESLKNFQHANVSKISKPIKRLMTIPKGSIHACNLCDRTFQNSVSIKWHMKRAHSKWTTNVKRYPCDLCPYVYDDEVGLKIHKGKSHATFQKTQKLLSSPQKESGPIAKANSPAKSLSQKHLKSPIDNSFKTSLFPCDQCTFATQDENAFHEHTQGCHVPDGMKCLWCPCSFSTKMNLVLHQMAHHPNCFDTTGVNWFQRKTGITEAGRKKAVDHESDSSSTEDIPHYKATEIKGNGSHNFRSKLKIQAPCLKGLQLTNECKKLFQCSKCSYTCMFNAWLVRHDKTCHYKNGVVCDMCPCSFQNKRRLLGHKNSRHRYSNPGSEDIATTKPTNHFQNTDLNKQTTSAHIDDDDLSKEVNDPSNHTNKNEALVDKQNDPYMEKTQSVSKNDLKDFAQTKALAKCQSMNETKKRYSPKSRPIRCITCGEVCRGPENFKIHQDKYHNESKTGKDLADRKNVSDVSEVLVNSSERHRCNDCACIFKTDIELNDHKRVQHSNDKEANISANITEPCDVIIAKQYDYEEFEQKDGTKILKCSVCKYSTDILLNMDSHFQTSHSEGTISCEFCPCRLSTPMNLFYHKSFFHSGNNNEMNEYSDSKDSNLLIGYNVDDFLKCAYCAFGCISIPNLEYHNIKTHSLETESLTNNQNPEDLEVEIADGTKKLFMPRTRLAEKEYMVRKVHSCGAPFSDLSDSTECKICSQKFKTSHLSLHVQLCHSKSQTAAHCNKCPCKYSTKSALQNHVEWSHKSKPPSENSSSIDLVEIEPLKDETVRLPYMCLKCGLRFALPASLNVHEEVSHVHGKHPCVICSCSFTTLYGLDGHVTGAHQVTRNILKPVHENKLAEKIPLPIDGTVFPSESVEKELKPLESNSDYEERPRRTTKSRKAEPDAHNNEYNSGDSDFETVTTKKGKKRRGKVEGKDRKTSLKTTDTSIKSIQPNAEETVPIKYCNSWKQPNVDKVERNADSLITADLILDEIMKPRIVPSGQIYNLKKSSLGKSSRPVTLGLEGTTSEIISIIDIPETKKFNEEPMIVVNPEVTEIRDNKRPPKRKSAEKASRVIRNAISECIPRNESIIDDPDNEVQIVPQSAKKKSSNQRFNERNYNNLTNKMGKDMNEKSDEEEIFSTTGRPQRKSAKRAAEVIKNSMSDIIEIELNDDDAAKNLLCEEITPSLTPPVKKNRIPKLLPICIPDSSRLVDLTTGDISETIEDGISNDIGNPRPRKANRSAERDKVRVCPKSKSLENQTAKGTVIESRAEIHCADSSPIKRKRTIMDTDVNAVVHENIRKSRAIDQAKVEVKESKTPPFKTSERKISKLNPARTLEMEVEGINSNNNSATSSQSIGRPPQRKSAAMASKIIVDVMNSEFNNRKLESVQKEKRMQWFKEFMKFVCSRCGIPFETNIVLTTHFQSCEKRCTKFPCGMCFNEFPTLLKLKEHLWKIHKPSYVSRKSESTPSTSTNGANSSKNFCIASPAASTSQKERPPRPLPHPYSCSLCKLGLKDRKALILHMSVPHLFRCKKCSYVCATKTLMESHKLEVHKPKESTSSSSRNVLDDKNRIPNKSPTKIKTLRTCKCGKRFSKPRDYEYHKLECKGQKGLKVTHPSDDIVIVYEQSSKTPEKDSTIKASDTSPNKCSSDKRKQAHSVRLDVVNDYSIIAEDPVCENQDLVSEKTHGRQRLKDSYSFEEACGINTLGETTENAESESMICQDCGYLATSVEDAQDHHNSVRNSDSMICDVCAYLATTGCDLKLHTKKNHPETFAVDRPTDLQSVELSLNNDCLSVSNAPENIRSETLPMQIEIEFQDNMGKDDMHEPGSEYMDFNVAQEIEVRDEAYVDPSCIGNGNGNEGLVLFNIADLDLQI